MWNSLPLSAVRVRIRCASWRKIYVARRKVSWAPTRGIWPTRTNPALAFDDGDDGGLAAAVDGVDLPVAQARPLGNDGRALRDHPLAGQAATAVVAPVALALLLAGAAQMTPKGATVRPVRPDVQVDRLMAHDLDALEPAAAHDLLRTEVLPQQALDGREVRRPVSAIAPRAAPPAVGLLHRPARPISPVVARPVPPHLARDGAAMPLQLLRNLADAGAPHPQGPDHISFFSTQLVVSHPLKCRTYFLNPSGRTRRQTQRRRAAVGHLKRWPKKMIPILADAGVPMVFVEVPAMLCALVPVIAIEILVASKILKMAPRRATKAIVTANLASTLLGFPLLWLLLVVVQMLTGGGRAYGLGSFWTRVYAVTVQAPWLIPYEKDLKWMIPAAAVYLLIPAFFASVFIERWICHLFWRDQEKDQMRRFSWAAHFASYAVLLILAVIYYGIVFRRG
jgi:hypothetical protein